jgi:hypothetical protein
MLAKPEPNRNLTVIDRIFRIKTKSFFMLDQRPNILFILSIPVEKGF